LMLDVGNAKCAGAGGTGGAGGAQAQCTQCLGQHGAATHTQNSRLKVEDAEEKTAGDPLPSQPQQSAGRQPQAHVSRDTGHEEPTRGHGGNADTRVNRKSGHVEDKTHRQQARRPRGPIHEGALAPAHYAALPASQRPNVPTSNAGQKKYESKKLAFLEHP